jgi:hypothetical protein
VNSEITHAAAWTPEGRGRMVENELLNEFAAALARLRAEYAAQPGDVDLPARVLVLRHRARRAAMDRQLVRTTVSLHAAGVF